MHRESRSFFVAAAVMLAVFASRAEAFTLWSEDAENGAGNVIDGTDASYSLIQSDVVGQGDFAFHMANPGFQDNWFVLDQTITIQPATKLFFLSRLGYATTSQFARVQISTNGGGSWTTNIYNQAGSNNAGEGAFALRELNLDSYVGQDLRFRFMYELTSGSAFPQTDPGVGWYVDNVQIGDQFEKAQYSIGQPTAHEQQYLEYLNRARADALVEAARLRDETDPDILSAYSFFGIDTQDIVSQFAWYVNNGTMDRYAQPLSFQPELLQAAQLHTQDMFNNQFQGHVSSSAPPAPFQSGFTLGQRLDAVGYNFTTAGENVFSHANSVQDGHAGFDVDWGNTTDTNSPFYNPDFVGQGMQNPSGHRINMHNNDFKEIGVGVVNGTNGSVGPQLVTQDFGSSGDVSYITGVVYEDLNANSFYDIGEGRSDVRIDVDGSPFYAISSTSGGYSIPVTEDGVYDIMFSGGGFDDFSTNVTVSGGWNVKVDYLAIVDPDLPGDLNSDGIVDARDYATWREGLGTDYTQYDYDTWVEHYGETDMGSGATVHSQGIPEPGSGLLFMIAGGFVATLRRSGRTRQNGLLKQFQPHDIDPQQFVAIAEIVE